MFFLELRTSDLHAALGRLLDQTRVAGLTLAGISAQAKADQCLISACIDVGDREAIDRLARRVGAIVCVDAVDVRSDCEVATPNPDALISQREGILL